jgi:formylglycine-generating enzyme
MRQPTLRHAEEQSAPQLVSIPAGWFVMGSESGQDNERPIHRVWVGEFLLAKCQVTNAEYTRFVQSTGRTAPPFWGDTALNEPEQPVVGVSWFDAVQYCEWISAATGRKFRLPTEAEWERAARGGKEGLLYPWGDEPPQTRPAVMPAQVSGQKRAANLGHPHNIGYAERWKDGPELVGLGESNAFGLFNMCDNVHEWCADWYSPDYYAVSPERNPRGPEAGERRASRGGSWRHHIKASRCAARSSIPPEFQYADYGFRVACDPVSQR